MGFEVNEKVVVHGLTSEQGQKLNGKSGTVTRFVIDKGRFEVRFDDDHVMQIKPENLSPAGRAGAGDLSAGDTVEIFGLQSERGSELNGRRGVLTRSLEERWEVRIDGSSAGSFDIVKLKAANLRRIAESATSTGQATSSCPKPGSSTAAVNKAKVSRGSATIRPGDLVEVFGLTSEAGQRLNGEEATVTDTDEDRGRAEVRFDQLGGKLQSLKLENLRKCEFMVGDFVEIVGLDSEKGEKLNGDKGTIRRFVEEKGRWEVEFIPRRLLSLAAQNLQRVDTAVLEGRA